MSASEADCEDGIRALARVAPVALGGSGPSQHAASTLGVQYLTDDPVLAAAAIAQATARPGVARI